MLAVYITMHGHLTPGGGFQGGVVAATALLLVYLGSDYDRMRRLRPRALVETGLGVLTALLGAVMALGQDHLKRLLAFVTISQIGLALIGVGLLTPAGIAGATLLIGADGLLRAGLFVCFGAVLHRCGSVYQSQLHGRGKLLPRAFGIFFVLGLAALPPRLGSSGVPAHRPARPADRGERARRLARSRPRGDVRQRRRLDRRRTARRVAAGRRRRRAARRHSFADRATYAATVLDRPPPRPAPVEYLHIHTVEVLLAIVTVLATIVLTGILLGRPRVTVPAAVAARVHAGFEKLRRQHSGQTGDYVAWATVGFALLGALIALATRGTP